MPRSTNQTSPVAGTSFTCDDRARRAGGPRPQRGRRRGANRGVLEPGGVRVRTDRSPEARRIRRAASWQPGQATDGNFYWTTSRGGALNAGTVFKMTPSGTLTILHEFTGNADGASPS